MRYFKKWFVGANLQIQKFPGRRIKVGLQWCNVERKIFRPIYTST